jgi:antitoxin component of RelBE/YafQ-DinJ toxin-antitoxin module
MPEGYQIIELKNRVSDVLTQMSIKVSNVLTVLGQRCADSYHIKAKHDRQDDQGFRRVSETMTQLREELHYR